VASTDEPSSPRALVASATGRGGVSSVTERVLPHLANAERVDVAPLPAALARVMHARYDVLHVHPSLRWRACLRDGLLAQTALGRGRRVVVQWHGWDPSQRERPVWTSGLWDGQHVVLTELQRERLQEWGVEEARIFSAVNPYDPAQMPERRSADEGSVVFVGRWVEEKGLDVLIGAMGQLPGVRCEIAGEGPARASMGTAILRHRCADRVSLLGWLDTAELQALWSRARVLVLPSVSESYPLVVVDALAAGVPVVATAVGAVPDLLQGAGFVVERSIEAVADGIRRALASPPPELGAVQARIRQTHHPSAVAARWMQLYRIAQC
jgi:glycosyltransferase involved in cell wall biosynthesis